MAVIAVGSVFLGMVCAMVCVLLGGWLVFRVKTIDTPMPFIQPKQKKTGKTHSYANENLFEAVDEFVDEELSPAAARLRSQSPGVTDIDDHKSILKKVMGK